MSEPDMFPEGFSVVAVDWLPSGARSGLVRVRGQRPPDVDAPLPELILEARGEVRRFPSLPDPRADRDATAWRGAYVLDARPAAEADRLWLEWPGGRRIALPGLSVPAHQVSRAQAPAPTPAAAAGEASGEVIDRAVLAERRARRAEASEQAQARIAREALRAVEVLELRAGEIEERLVETMAERDVLRERAAGAAQDPDERVELLEQEIRELRAELARSEAAPPPVVAAPAPAPIAASDAERRAERLRAALASTIATVAELRLRLHEADVARRTRQVAASADAVRLAVVDRERETLTEALAAAQTQLRAARQARDDAVAALEGARAAQEDLRRRVADQSVELGSVRERAAALEAEVAAVTAEAERAAEEAVAAVRAEAEAAAEARARERESEAVRRVAEAEALVERLRAQLERSEAAIAAAETARELAEATALAATTERRAAEVAHAASQAPPVAPQRLSSLQDELRIARAELAAARAAAPPAATTTEAPVGVPDLVAAAEQQARAAAERQPTQESERVVADLSAAADALRARPRIVSAPTDPPGDLVRGRHGRDYPPLRGALVKLAHDDPAAAGRLMAGLLHAQHAVLDHPPDYDLTIAEVGTFAVSAAGQTTLVNRLEAPRGRSQATFHLSTDALTLAEILVGVEQRPRRRRGPLRASGRVRQARRLAETLRPDASLEDLVRAGADLEPELVLRGLAYAIKPAWTRGQSWVVELHVEGRPLTVAGHSGGLAVSDGASEAEPDARVRLSRAAFRALVAGESPDFVTEGDEQVVRRLLSLAERARRPSGD